MRVEPISIIITRAPGFLLTPTLPFHSGHYHHHYNPHNHNHRQGIPLIIISIAIAFSIIITRTPGFLLTPGQLVTHSNRSASFHCDRYHRQDNQHWGFPVITIITIFHCHHHYNQHQHQLLIFNNSRLKH